MSDENHLITERRQKLQTLRDAEGIAFPNDFRRTHVASELHEKYDEVSKEELDPQGIEVAVVGIGAKLEHSTDEHIYIEDMNKALNMVVEILRLSSL